jgi:hypothetical protein
MDVERFDYLSRKFARGAEVASTHRLGSSLAGTLTGLTGWLLGRNTAQAQGRNCDPSSVGACMDAVLTLVESQLTACWTGCSTISDPKAQAKACGVCLDAMARDGQEGMIRCNALACGTGYLCHKVSFPLFRNTGYCCPFGHLPSPLPQLAVRPPRLSAVPSSDPVCRPGCQEQITGQPLACSYPFTLNTTYCVCVCDFQTLQCPSGMNLDPVACQCV